MDHLTPICEAIVRSDRMEDQAALSTAILGFFQAPRTICPNLQRGPNTNNQHPIHLFGNDTKHVINTYPVAAASLFSSNLAELPSPSQCLNTLASCSTSSSSNLPLPPPPTFYSTSIIRDLPPTPATDIGTANRGRPALRFTTPSRPFQCALSTDGSSRRVTSTPDMLDGTCAFVLRYYDSHTQKNAICEGQLRLPRAQSSTNNFAEYQAVLFGLKQCISLGLTSTLLRVDSDLVLTQLQGSAACNNTNLRNLRDNILELVTQKGISLVIQHVEGHTDDVDNIRADYLANKTHDFALGNPPVYKRWYKNTNHPSTHNNTQIYSLNDTFPTHNTIESMLSSYPFPSTSTSLQTHITQLSPSNTNNASDAHNTLTQLRPLSTTTTANTNNYYTSPPIPAELQHHASLKAEEKHLANKVRRVIKLAKNNHFSKAMEIGLRTDHAILDPTSPLTVLKLINLHPSYHGPFPNLPSNSQAAGFTSDKVFEALESIDNGSAAGITQWNPALLRLCFRHQALTDALIIIISKINNDCLHPELREIILASTLLPTPKMTDNVQTGVRPIAMTDFIFRLASKLATSKLPNGETLFPNGIQMGCGIKGGPQKAIQGIRAALELDPDMVDIKGDMDNAFNNANRGTMAKAFFDNPKLRAAHRIYHFAYKSPTPLIVTDPITNNTVIISSDNGNRQGDALSLYAFTNMVDIAYAEVQRRCPNVSLVSIVDDIHFVGTTQNAATAFSLFKTYVETHPEYGIKLNLRKCGIFSLSKDRSDSIQSVATTLGIKCKAGYDIVLGTPLGNDDTSIQRALNLDIDETFCKFRKVLLHALMPPRLAYVLIRMCIIPRYMHIIRTARPSSIAPSISHFDNEVRKLTIDTLKLPDSLSDETLAHINLPIRLGGLGLRSLSMILNIASYSCVTECLPNTIKQIKILVPDAANPPTSVQNIPTFTDARNTFRSLQSQDAATTRNLLTTTFDVTSNLPHAIPTQPPKKLQAELTKIADKSVSETLKNFSTYHKWQLRVVSSFPLARLILTCTADTSKHFSDSDFLLFIRHHLLLPVLTSDTHCRLCGSRDIGTQHALTCKHLLRLSILQRHDALARYLVKSFTDHCHLEASVLSRFHSNTAMAGDLTFYTRENDKIMCDIQVTSLNSTQAQQARSFDDYFDARAAAKTKKYAVQTATAPTLTTFIPLIFDQNGNPSKSTTRCFNIAKKSASIIRTSNGNTSSWIKHTSQEIHFLLQKQNILIYKQHALLSASSTTSQRHDSLITLPHTTVSSSTTNTTPPPASNTSLQQQSVTSTTTVPSTTHTNTARTTNAPTTVLHQAITPTLITTTTQQTLPSPYTNIPEDRRYTRTAQPPRTIQQTLHSPYANISTRNRYTRFTQPPHASNTSQLQQQTVTTTIAVPPTTRTTTAPTTNRVTSTLPTATTSDTNRSSHTRQQHATRSTRTQQVTTNVNTAQTSTTNTRTTARSFTTLESTFPNLFSTPCTVSPVLQNALTELQAHQHSLVLEQRPFPTVVSTGRQHQRTNQRPAQSTRQLINPTSATTPPDTHTTSFTSQAQLTSPPQRASATTNTSSATLNQLIEQSPTNIARTLTATPPTSSSSLFNHLCNYSSWSNHSSPIFPPSFSPTLPPSLESSQQPPTTQPTSSLTIAAIARINTNPTAILSFDEATVVLGDGTDSEEDSASVQRTQTQTTHQSSLSKSPYQEAPHNATSYRPSTPTSASALTPTSLNVPPPRSTPHAPAAEHWESCPSPTTPAAFTAIVATTPFPATALHTLTSLLPFIPNTPTNTSSTRPTEHWESCPSPSISAAPTATTTTPPPATTSHTLTSLPAPPTENSRILHACSFPSSTISTAATSAITADTTAAAVADAISAAENARDANANDTNPNSLPN